MTNNMKILHMFIFYFLSKVVLTESKSLIKTVSKGMNNAGYGMYVWREGWDPAVPGCNDAAFLAWEDEKCFTHSWNTPDKRKWLFDTCKRPGREITTLYLYDMQRHLEQMDCETDAVKYIRETIHLGKTEINSLEIYGLLSIGGVDVPEKDWVKYFIWYNEHCAQNDTEKIDGVAVNNEDYDRSWPEEDKTMYLDNLQVIADEANKQLPPGSFKTHFSMGWVWGRDDDGNNIEVTWKGSKKYIMEHFIDIFTSIDTQVAFVTADTMLERLLFAGWNYSNETGKQMLATVYINKSYPCQTTFFPFPEDDPDCPAWSHGYETEDAMFEQLDALQASQPGVRVVLHYFRGAYSSGGYNGWPSHEIEETIIPEAP